MEVGSKGWQEWGLDNSSQFLIDQSWNRKCAWWYPAGTRRNFNIDVGHLKKGNFFLAVSLCWFPLTTLKPCKSSSMKLGSRRTLFTRRLTSASDFVDVPESFQFISISTDSFRWTGDRDGGQINTGSVPPTQWRSSSGIKESGTKEGWSRYSRSKPKEFVAAHSWLCTIKCRQGNAAVGCLSSSSSSHKGSGLKSSYRAGSW